MTGTASTMTDRLILVGIAWAWVALLIGTAYAVSWWRGRRRSVRLTRSRMTGEFPSSNVVSRRGSGSPDAATPGTPEPGRGRHPFLPPAGPPVPAGGGRTPQQRRDAARAQVRSGRWGG